MTNATLWPSTDARDRAAPGWTFGQLALFTARGLTWLAVLALAIVTAATFFGRYNWIADLFTHFRPQLLALAALCLVVTAALRQWSLAVVALACLGVHLTPLLAPIPAGAAVAAGPSVRLLELNVEHNNDRYAAFADLLRREHPDIVVLAETWSRGWHDHLTAMHDAFPYASLSFPHGRQDVTILSRYPITGVELLHPYWPDGKRLYYTIVEARIDVKGEPLTVYAVHPPHPADRALWRQRNAYLGWLARRVAAAPAGSRIVVAGDFNATPWTPWYGRFLEESGLADGAGTSWQAPTRHPIWPVRWAWLGIPIDHVTISRRIAVDHYRVGKDVGSDHLPVLADLRLPRP